MDQETFVANLMSTVDAKFGAILAAKPEGKQHLTYIDATTMSACIRNVFKNLTGIVPVQIEAVCRLSEAVLAPTITEKKRLIKSVLGIAGGTGGIAMIIGGIGMALVPQCGSNYPHCVGSTRRLRGEPLGLTL